MIQQQARLTSIHHLSTNKNYQNEQLKDESNGISLTDISDLKNGIIGEALFNEAI